MANQHKRGAGTSRGALAVIAMLLLGACGTQEPSLPRAGDAPGSTTATQGTAPPGTPMDSATALPRTAPPGTAPPGTTMQSIAPSAASREIGPTNGPLRAIPESRYFTDQTGAAVLLTGSHTWNNLLDYAAASPVEPSFDFDRYVDFLVANGHNFVRLWTHEQAAGFPADERSVHIAPNVYSRPGPGEALDALPAFDLNRFDEGYFRRLRERVELARDNGVYVAVMLFNGWSLDNKGGGSGNPCAGHPYFGSNNINGIDVDVNGNGYCEEAHTLAVPEVTRLQEAYVTHVIETVGDLDNVLYEVSNESPSGSLEWQNHIADYIRTVESGRSLAHPIGITVEYPDGDNAGVFASHADWVSPNDLEVYGDDPPPATGDRVVVLDTDHLWGIGGDAAWVWRAFTRGYNVAYMDCYDYTVPECPGSPDDAVRLGVVTALGAVQSAVEGLDLGRLLPLPDRCSTGFCLIDDSGPIPAAIVYAPDGGEVVLDLSSQAVTYSWYTPESGWGSPQSASGAAPLQVQAPLAGAVLRVVGS